MASGLILVGYRSNMVSLVEGSYDNRLCMGLLLEINVNMNGSSRSPKDEIWGPERCKNSMPGLRCYTFLDSILPKWVVRTPRCPVAVTANLTPYRRALT